MDTQINTASEAIEALGGTKAVAELFGFEYRVVQNWHARGLPAHTFWTFKRLLSEKGMFAPASLWRQREPVDPLLEAGE